MKNIPLLLFLLLPLSLPLFADEIYLFDNTVQTVTIINLTDKNIEYNENNKAVRKISKDQVKKIVYSSGKEIEFYDNIYLKNGTILKGRVVNKNNTFIEYKPEEQIYSGKIDTSKILKIIYVTGKVENFTNSDETDLIYFKNGKVFKASEIVINEKDIEFLDENNIKQFYGRSMIEKILYGGKVIFMDEITSDNEKKKDAAEVSVSNKSVISFFEIESGWNGYAGIGCRYDYLLFNNFGLNGAVGIGFWGYRLSGALRYYLNYPYGLAFTIGAAYNKGGPSNPKMETQDTSAGNIYKETIDINLKPVTCINATLLYSIQVYGDDKIYIETGYSYALNKKKLSYKTETGRELTKESQVVIDDLESLAPGGLIISVGYAFAL